MCNRKVSIFAFLCCLYVHIYKSIHIFIAYLDLRATSLIGQVSSEICAVGIESLFADCSEEDLLNDSIFFCTCCTWCEKV
jgi:hypothetical protein